MQYKPALHTCLSPALLHLYDLNETVVVVIDVFRATSTIAAALYNGAEAVVPVDTVPKAIQIAQDINGIAAGERDGKIADGLQHGNSPLEYHRDFIGGRKLVLTTTNGTKLLHMALQGGAKKIITGSFGNLSAVCEFLRKEKKPVLLGCAGWKDRFNFEDTMFAGAVISQIAEQFEIHCDASKMALGIYHEAQPDYFGFMQRKEATHYHRLMQYGLENDIKHCLTPDTAPVLPLYKDGKLIQG